MTHRSSNTRIRTVLAMTSVLVVTAFSGCLGIEFTDGDDDTEATKNAAPTAVLDADKTAGFSAETFTFDGRASSDRDGRIANWTFDFGDGETATVHDEDSARVQHQYDTPGAYVVTLTVADTPGTEDALPRHDDAKLLVVVHERYNVQASVASGANNLSKAFAVDTQDIRVYDDADRFELDLEATSALAAGTTEIRIALHDPDGVAILNETVTLGAGESEELAYDGALLVAGNHTLIITAESGAATVDGELRNYYAHTEADA